MDSGQPLHGFRNDGLSRVDRSQKFLGFLKRRKTAKLAAVEIVFDQKLNEKIVAGGSGSA
jgi:hypothetical protein